MDKKPIVSMIAAIGRNRELGRDNKLLFNIPEDMKRFRKLTSGHVVIMGRKTFESIGRPLLNRINIIITRDKDYKPPDTCMIYHTIDEALEYAKKVEFKKNGGGAEAFIIGGGQIYSLGIKFANKLYLTVADKEVPDADAFFPDYSGFKKIVSEVESEENGIKYMFLELER